MYLKYYPSAPFFTIYGTLRLKIRILGIVRPGIFLFPGRRI